MRALLSLSALLVTSPAWAGPSPSSASVPLQDSPGATGSSDLGEVDGDEPTQPAPLRWTVTVDPLTTVLGFVHLQVERTLSPHVSVYAGPSLHLYDPIWESEHDPYAGVGVELGVRWFPMGRSPRGPWLMTRAVVAVLSTTDGTNQTAPGGYASLLGGYTWVLADRFVVSLGVGAQRLQYRVADYGIEGFAPAAHTNLGVAF